MFSLTNGVDFVLYYSVSTWIMIIPEYSKHIGASDKNVWAWKPFRVPEIEVVGAKTDDSI